MNNPLLQAATKYAKIGWHIHPCKLDKTPLLPDWPNNATTNIEQITKWWTGEYLGASIGCACGHRSGIFVLDVDLPDGEKSLKGLQATYGLIPDTLEQITGSGGRQLFFKYENGIKNSTSRIAKNLDIRGEHGSVILPPSPHPSGNKYKWKNKRPIASAPPWLISLIKKTKKPLTTYRSAGQSSAYGRGALSKLLIELSSAVKGSRNDTLNRVSFAAGQLISGGELSESEAINSFLAAATVIGLSEKEALATINSGIRSGSLDPRCASEGTEYYTDDTESYASMSSDVSVCKPMSADVSNVSNMSASCKHDVSRCKQMSADVSTGENKKIRRSRHSIMGAIGYFIENSNGSFTTQYLDHELGLTTRKEKNARARAVSLYNKNNIIIKDKRIAGKYHIVDNKIDWVDYNSKAEEKFLLKLPFGLHEHVLIPPKSIIILAGSSNAGKTSLCLNTLYDNLDAEYPLVYLMSEMGDGEFLSRIKKFEGPIEQWHKVKAASKSTGFDGIVRAHNPNGLTCIDYLEEVEGEYFKIPSDIRAIYDGLKEGVAIVAIQKHSKQEISRGGEGTLEKARLYLSLDTLCVKDHSIICALKIMKLKNFIGKNLQHHEIHFEISNGSQIQPITEWMPCHEVDRAKKIKQYSRSDGYFYFTTKSGDKVRVLQSQADDWQAKFRNIDVYDELDRIGEASKTRPFLEDKGWFFQLPGILAKKNKER